MSNHYLKINTKEQLFILFSLSNSELIFWIFISISFFFNNNNYIYIYIHTHFNYYWFVSNKITFYLFIKNTFIFENLFFLPITNTFLKMTFSNFILDFSSHLKVIKLLKLKLRNTWLTSPKQGKNWKVRHSISSLYIFTFWVVFST